MTWQQVGTAIELWTECFQTGLQAAVFLQSQIASSSIERTVTEWVCLHAQNRTGSSQITKPCNAMGVYSFINLEDFMRNYLDKWIKAEKSQSRATMCADEDVNVATYRQRKEQLLQFQHGFICLSWFSVSYSSHAVNHYSSLHSDECYM